MVTDISPQTGSVSQRDQVLSELQKKVLWLSILMVHHANHVRPNPDNIKVGGHQTSSSSVVTILTSLFFDYMGPGDKISIKPHASPVLHAINFLLGNLDGEYLKKLRQLHGLQSYPSRTKDPDPVDFASGSVGLGAVAPNFASLVAEYAGAHGFGAADPRRRYISLIGDAELDEGSIWEALAEPAFADVENVLWVVDLNRQSLDRVIPGIRVKAWRQMFSAIGWRTIDAKYGKRLQAAYAMPKGELLREAIDEMPNEVYQRLLRVPPETLREWLPRTSRHPGDLTDFIGQWGDRELQDLIRNLGGHDFSMLREALDQTKEAPGPHVLFAYTLKGWMLPNVGDPQNHSVLLTAEQMEELREQMGIPEEQMWDRFDPDSPAGRHCEQTRRALQAPPAPPPLEMQIRKSFDSPYQGVMSTQQIFGLVLTSISRDSPELADRVVTVSPDVASSTNLGGWINKAGIWGRGEPEEMPEESIVRALKWEESPRGQHIQLGISENNLFMMLGQLGLSHELNGEVLFPIGTLYDPFVRRGLDALTYSVYSGGKFIFVGTPSGLTLGAEGGSHQSLITPAIGTEMPDVAYYEPCFGYELEWIMLSALDQVRLRRESTYLRLTTKRIDQALFRMPPDPRGREVLRAQVLTGAYRLVDRSAEPDYRPGENVVHVVASGAMVPEAVQAGDRLMDEGILANVINVTGPGPLYKRFNQSVRARMGVAPGPTEFLVDVIPPEERGAPVVTVVDGHPHSLAWLGGALDTAVYPLGVTSFGQSGAASELYVEYGIDVSSIMAACFGALGM